MSATVLILICRLIIATVLLLAASAKAVRIGEFTKIIKGFQIGPGRLAPMLSRIIVGAEFIAGLGLLFGLFVVPSAVLGAALFSTFASAIAFNLLRGRSDIPCGCFGSTGLPISWKLVGRNLVLIALTLVPVGSEAYGVTLCFAAVGIAAVTTLPLRRHSAFATQVR